MTILFKFSKHRKNKKQQTKPIARSKYVQYLWDSILFKK